MTKALSYICPVDGCNWAPEYPVIRRRGTPGQKRFWRRRTSMGALATHLKAKHGLRFCQTYGDPYSPYARRRKRCRELVEPPVTLCPKHEAEWQAQFDERERRRQR